MVFFISVATDLFIPTHQQTVPTLMGEYVCSQDHVNLTILLVSSSMWNSSCDSGLFKNLILFRAPHSPIGGKYQNMMCGGQTMQCGYGKWVNIRVLPVCL